jgi:hypothetical protein
VSKRRVALMAVLTRKSLLLRHAPGVIRTHNLLIRSHIPGTQEGRLDEANLCAENEWD